MDNIDRDPIVGIEADETKTVADLGLSQNNLIKLTLKIIYVRGVETARELALEIGP